MQAAVGLGSSVFAVEASGNVVRITREGAFRALGVAGSGGAGDEEDGEFADFEGEEEGGGEEDAGHGRGGRGRGEDRSKSSQPEVAIAAGAGDLFVAVGTRLWRVYAPETRPQWARVSAGSLPRTATGTASIGSLLAVTMASETAPPLATPVGGAGGASLAGGPDRRSGRLTSSVPPGSDPRQAMQALRSRGSGSRSRASVARLQGSTGGGGSAQVVQEGILLDKRDKGVQQKLTLPPGCATIAAWGGALVAWGEGEGAFALREAAGLSAVRLRVAVDAVAVCPCPWTVGQRFGPPRALISAASIPVHGGWSEGGDSPLLLAAAQRGGRVALLSGIPGTPGRVLQETASVNAVPGSVASRAGRFVFWHPQWHTVRVSRVGAEGAPSELCTVADVVSIALCDAHLATLSANGALRIYPLGANGRLRKGVIEHHLGAGEGAPAGPATVTEWGHGVAALFGGRIFAVSSLAGSFEEVERACSEPVLTEVWHDATSLVSAGDRLLVGDRRGVHVVDCTRRSTLPALVDPNLFGQGRANSPATFRQPQPAGGDGEAAARAPGPVLAVGGGKLFIAVAGTVWSVPVASLLAPRSGEMRLEAVCRAPLNVAALAVADWCRSFGRGFAGGAASAEAEALGAGRGAVVETSLHAAAVSAAVALRRPGGGGNAALCPASPLLCRTLALRELRIGAWLQRARGDELGLAAAAAKDPTTPAGRVRLLFLTRGGRVGTKPLPAPCEEGELWRDPTRAAAAGAPAEAAGGRGDAAAAPLVQAARGIERVDKGLQRMRDPAARALALTRAMPLLVASGNTVFAVGSRVRPMQMRSAAPGSTTAPCAPALASIRFGAARAAAVVEETLFVVTGEGQLMRCPLSDGAVPERLSEGWRAARAAFSAGRGRLVVVAGDSAYMFKHPLSSANYGVVSQGNWATFLCATALDDAARASARSPWLAHDGPGHGAGVYAAFADEGLVRFSSDLHRRRGVPLEGVDATSITSLAPDGCGGLCLAVAGPPVPGLYRWGPHSGAPRLIDTRRMAVIATAVPGPAGGDRALARALARTAERQHVMGTLLEAQRALERGEGAGTLGAMLGLVPGAGAPVYGAAAGALPVAAMSSSAAGSADMLHAFVRRQAKATQTLGEQGVSRLADIAEGPRKKGRKKAYVFPFTVLDDRRRDPMVVALRLVYLAIFILLGILLAVVYPRLPTEVTQFTVPTNRPIQWRLDRCDLALVPGPKEGAAPGDPLWGKVRLGREVPSYLEWMFFGSSDRGRLGGGNLRVWSGRGAAGEEVTVVELQRGSMDEWECEAVVQVPPSGLSGPLPAMKFHGESDLATSTGVLVSWTPPQPSAAGGGASSGVSNAARTLLSQAWALFYGADAGDTDATAPAAVDAESLADAAGAEDPLLPHVLFFGDHDVALTGRVTAHLPNLFAGSINATLQRGSVYLHSLTTARGAFLRTGVNPVDGTLCPEPSATATRLEGEDPCTVAGGDVVVSALDAVTVSATQPRGIICLTAGTVNVTDTDCTTGAAATGADADVDVDASNTTQAETGAAVLPGGCTIAGTLCRANDTTCGTDPASWLAGAPRQQVACEVVDGGCYVSLPAGAVPAVPASRYAFKAGPAFAAGTAAIAFDAAADRELTSVPEFVAEDEAWDVVVATDVVDSSLQRLFMYATRLPYVELEPHWLSVFSASLLRPRMLRVEAARLVPGICPHSALPHTAHTVNENGAVSEALRRATAATGDDVVARKTGDGTVRLRQTTSGAYAAETVSFGKNAPLAFAVVVSFVLAANFGCGGGAVTVFAGHRFQRYFENWLAGRRKLNDAKARQEREVARRRLHDARAEEEAGDGAGGGRDEEEGKGGGKGGGEEEKGEGEGKGGEGSGSGRGSGAGGSGRPSNSGAFAVVQAVAEGRKGAEKHPAAVQRARQLRAQIKATNKTRARQLEDGSVDLAFFEIPSLLWTIVGPRLSDSLEAFLHERCVTAPKVTWLVRLRRVVEAVRKGDPSLLRGGADAEALASHRVLLSKFKKEYESYCTRTGMVEQRVRSRVDTLLAAYNIRLVPESRPVYQGIRRLRRGEVGTTKPRSTFIRGPFFYFVAKYYVLTGLESDEVSKAELDAEFARWYRSLPDATDDTPAVQPHDLKALGIKANPANVRLWLRGLILKSAVEETSGSGSRSSAATSDSGAEAEEKAAKEGQAERRAEAADRAKGLTASQMEKRRRQRQRQRQREAKERQDKEERRQRRKQLAPRGRLWWLLEAALVQSHLSMLVLLAAPLAVLALWMQSEYQYTALERGGHLRLEDLFLRPWLSTERPVQDQNVVVLVLCAAFLAVGTVELAFFYAFGAKRIRFSRYDVVGVVDAAEKEAAVSAQTMVEFLLLRKDLFPIKVVKTQRERESGADAADQKRAAKRTKRSCRRWRGSTVCGSASLRACAAAAASAVPTSRDAAVVGARGRARGRMAEQARTPPNSGRWTLPRRGRTSAGSSAPWRRRVPRWTRWTLPRWAPSGSTRPRSSRWTSWRARPGAASDGLRRRVPGTRPGSTACPTPGTRRSRPSWHHWPHQRARRSSPSPRRLAPRPRHWRRHGRRRARWGRRRSRRSGGARLNCRRCDSAARGTVASCSPRPMFAPSSTRRRRSQCTRSGPSANSCPNWPGSRRSPCSRPSCSSSGPPCSGTWVWSSRGRCWVQC